MLIRRKSPLHLMYCLNFGPVDSSTAFEEKIETHLLPVRNTIAEDRPFAVGPWFNHVLAARLQESGVRDALIQFLRRHALYICSLNGFPYGSFHGEAIKEHVYEPNWRTEARKSYTLQLAQIFAEILPTDVSYGSISTVPGAFAAHVTSPEYRREIIERLTETAFDLAALKSHTGAEICLGLEPEPGCLLDTLEETLGFFEELHDYGAHHLQTIQQLGQSEAATILQTHIGVCLDTCHAATNFEDPLHVLKALKLHGIRIPKAQLSSGLHVDLSSEGLACIEAFDDPIYLHQAVARDEDLKHRWNDLQQALTDLKKLDNADALRVHFHVPLSWKGDKQLQPSWKMDSSFLDALAECGVEHAEIETYTYDVLPETLAPSTLKDGILSEYETVLNVAG
jgi:sugar phosphate isomerase/epimerase